MKYIKVSSITFYVKQKNFLYQSNQFANVYKESHRTFDWTEEVTLPQFLSGQTKQECYTVDLQDKDNTVVVVKYKYEKLFSINIRTFII